MAQEKIRRKIASSGMTSAQAVIDAGEFLSYAEAADIKQFVRRHPELFFRWKILGSASLLFGLWRRPR